VFEASTQNCSSSFCVLKQKPQSVQQVRIVPKADHYVVEVVYQAEVKAARVLDRKLFVALDPGVNVLAALTSNKPGFIPRLVSGGPAKAVNQLYNKQREHEQKQLAKGREPRFTSHRLDRITTKRNRQLRPARKRGVAEKRETAPRAGGHDLHRTDRNLHWLCVRYQRAQSIGAEKR
jgi:transposase